MHGGGNSAFATPTPTDRHARSAAHTPARVSERGARAEAACALTTDASRGSRGDSPPRGPCPKARWRAHRRANRQGPAQKATRWSAHRAHSEPSRGPARASESREDDGATALLLSLDCSPKLPCPAAACSASRIHAYHSPRFPITPLGARWPASRAQPGTR